MNLQTLWIVCLLVLAACSSPTPFERMEIAAFDNLELASFRIHTSDSLLVLHNEEEVFVYKINDLIVPIDTIRIPDTLWNTTQPKLDTATYIIHPSDHSSSFINRLTDYYIENVAVSGDSLLFIEVKFNYPHVTSKGTSLGGARWVFAFELETHAIKYRWKTWGLVDSTHYTSTTYGELPILFIDDIPILVQEYHYYKPDSSTGLESIGSFLLSHPTDSNFFQIISTGDTANWSKPIIHSIGNRLVTFKGDLARTHSIREEFDETYLVPKNNRQVVDLSFSLYTPIWLYRNQDSISQQVVFQIFKDQYLAIQDTVLSYQDMSCFLNESQNQVLFFYEKNNRTIMLRF